MTLADCIARLERLCALIRAVYDSHTDEEFEAAQAKVREAMKL